MALPTNAADAIYGDAFFAGIEEGTRRSAEVMAPLLLELFLPRSIVDVGGGTGQWAAAFLARGVEDVLTIDGPWVPKSARAVPPDRFLEHDLTAPLTLDRSFDLALCVEAAEHLPAAAAPDLVRTLTEAAPVVVFSAALPGQGGEGHLNEQPPSYWASLFSARDYACFPGLRRRIWNQAAVEVWYRQNLLCFVRRSAVERWAPALGPAADMSDAVLDIAHPELLRRHKARGDQLEAYARRLESEVTALRSDLADVSSLLERRQAELDAVPWSRIWRAWRRVDVTPRLRGLIRRRQEAPRRAERAGRAR